MTLFFKRTSALVAYTALIVAAILVLGPIPMLDSAALVGLVVVSATSAKLLEILGAKRITTVAELMTGGIYLLLLLAWIYSSEQTAMIALAGVMITIVVTTITLIYLCGEAIHQKIQARRQSA